LTYFLFDDQHNNIVRTDLDVAPNLREELARLLALQLLADWKIPLL
jgi:hypothetical protein